jgi:hypothetical protein
MTPTQQELYTHIKKHSGLTYFEVYQDIGEWQGGGVVKMVHEIEILIAMGKLEEKKPEFTLSVRAA